MPSRPTRDLVLTLAGGALYGAVLGSWGGGDLALYAALKLPLALLLTAAFTLLFNTLVARLLGENLTLGEVVRLNLAACAVMALVLAALAPVAALFTWTFEAPSPEARTAHNLLYLLHVLLVALAGLAGTFALRAQLRRRSRVTSGWRGGRLFAIWVITLALVGGEVTWALRPFVGSVYEPVTFLRRDALNGNVYEFIWRDIVPYLATSRRSRDSSREGEPHVRTADRASREPTAEIRTRE
ncbi:MAG: hypothetical protein AAF604_24105 [Acidobacteriota bacterium]